MCVSFLLIIQTSILPSIYLSQIHTPPTLHTITTLITLPPRSIQPQPCSAQATTTTTMTTSEAPTNKAATEAPTPTTTIPLLTATDMAEVIPRTRVVIATVLPTRIPTVIPTRTRAVEGMEVATTAMTMIRVEDHIALLIPIPTLIRTRTRAVEGTEEVTMTMRDRTIPTRTRALMEKDMEAAAMTRRIPTLRVDLGALEVWAVDQVGLRVRSSRRELRLRRGTLRKRGGRFGAGKDCWNPSRI
ncbi:hypothetical protein DL95DRAFT_382177 [Leptodontidium sp. 2 PMI_412]|nr:hypothetical protein DL95DRAFT_382177 [Leptodontidium sp. 2 PMI_412]